MTVVRDGREDLAAAAGAGVGRPGRGARRGGRPPVEGKAPPPPSADGSRSSASPPRCCSWSPAFSPNELIGHFTVFALAVVVGYYVIGHVHHALHTPLMSRHQRDLRDHRGRRAAADRPRRTARSPCWPPSRSCWPASTSSAASPSPAGCSACSRAATERPMTATMPPRRGLHRRRRCCSSSAWPGCPGTRPRRPATRFGIAGMAIALAATIGLATRSISGIGLTLLVVAMLIGAAIGLWRARAGRDDRHARADRDAAQLRRPGRRAGRLERLPRRSRPTRRRRPRSPATCSASTPPRSSSASSSARSPSPARSSPSSSCRGGSSPTR